ncbi:unnamed protein product [Cuscuta epithymum]|uniref:Alpha/beta hydrolase fold-3 domain-containing protein n=1 Tax=Cuscuta epithymum TaxID=186058 RepID=A0AAV0DSH7_9ASTE|nr:unnamed protein product [Cuscuta epithymum]
MEDGHKDSSDILYNLIPLIKIYKDGRVERLCGTDVVPAGFDAETGVLSKDVEISPEVKLSTRLYLPKTAGRPRKLPLLLYFHGGGFVVESAFSPMYQKPLNLLSAEANVVVASVNYRLAPEHPLPAAYEDAWAALKWAASHSSGRGDGYEEWLTEHVDFDRVFLGGDSVGANIAHNLAIRVGSGGNMDGVNLVGLFFNCPFFWGEDRVGDEAEHTLICNFVENTWRVAHPKAMSLDDPNINPAKDPDLGNLGCKRVIVYVAEKDPSRHRGWLYKEALGRIGWEGEVEVVEVKGEPHIFNLVSPTCDNAMAILRNLASFFHL